MPAAAAVPSTPHDSGWLTLNEAAKRLRFGSGRTLAAYLRRKGLPVPLYTRVGQSTPYFVRIEDVDKAMQVVPVRPMPAEVDQSEPRESATFERVDDKPGPRAVATRRRRGRKP